MGQGQSSLSDQNDNDVVYSPSAIGYTKPPKQHYSKKIFYAASKGHIPKQSLAGPIRNQHRKKYNVPISNSGIDLEERKESVDLLRQVVASTLGTAIILPEELNGTSSGWDSCIPTVSISGPSRVPAQETIIEETDSMMPESSRLACLELPADSHVGTLEENSTRYDRALLSVSDADCISRRGSASTLLRNLTDETDGQILLAYWQDEGNQKVLQRRHSLSKAEGISINDVSRISSPNQNTPRRRTSSWTAKETKDGDKFRRKMDKSQSELLCVPPARSYRKPAPMTSLDDDVVVAEKMHTKSISNKEMQQYILWPAKEDFHHTSDTEQGNLISRASVSSEALHSHVDAIRDGPRFFVDPSASDLMKSVDNALDPTTQQLSSSVAIRPRKISLIDKLKYRIRRSSEIPMKPSLMSASTSTPGFKHVLTPKVQGNMHDRDDAKLKQESGPKRNRKSALDSKEADILAAKVAKRLSSCSSHQSLSSSTRSKGQSVKSRRSRNSRASTPRQQSDKEGTSTGKTRSQLQPLPRQRHWWKQRIRSKKAPEESLVSKVMETIESGRRRAYLITTDSQIVAEGSTDSAQVFTRDSPPFAFINSEDNWTPDPNEYSGFGFSCSSSDFSSLARASMPAPIPPPRPSRRQGHSSSNGGDYSSPPSPIVSQVRRESYQYRLESPLGRAVSPMTLSAFTMRPKSALFDHDEKVEGETIDSREYLKTIDDSSCGEPRRPAHQFGIVRAVEDSVDNNDDDSEFGILYDSAMSKRGQLASIGLLDEIKGMKRRSLPRPTNLAEPRTDLQSVKRGNSIGSSKTASTFGGKKTLRTNVKEEHRSPTFALTSLRRSLPPTSHQSDKSFSMSKPSLSSVKGLPMLKSANEEILSSNVASSTLGKKSGRITIRESWNSSDGPWEARVVNMETKKLSPVRGFAQPVKQRSLDLLQRGQSNTSMKEIQVEERERKFEMEEASNPVPFAETAVQASLAALKALEETEQSGEDDLRSRWKRERLMGSSNTYSTAVSSVSKLEVNVGEFYTSYRRRRTAPYPPSEDVLGVKERQKSKKKRNYSKKNLDNNSSFASQTEDHSVFLTFTSDSDHARHGHEQEDERKGIVSRKASNRKGMNRKSASTIQGTNVSHALAKRFKEESEVDAEVAKATRKLRLPDDRVFQQTLQDEPSYDSVLLHTWKKLESMREMDLPSRERLSKKEAQQEYKGNLNTRQGTEVRHAEKTHRDDHQHSVTSPLPRQSKIRKGYGCEDIKAWQASLRLAPMHIPID